jgi:hypothetical protein
MKSPMKKSTTTRKASAPKAKTVKKMQEGGKTPTPPKKTYKTAAGAQQYIKGDNREERARSVAGAKRAALRALGEGKFNPELYSRLSAADDADAAKNIRAAAPNSGKSSAKLFDKFEREAMARAKDAKKARGDKTRR